MRTSAHAEERNCTATDSAHVQVAASPGDVTAADCATDTDADFTAIDRAWTEWSRRTGVRQPNFTEALRFFGHLIVEHPDVLEFSSNEKTQWEIVLVYLNTQRA